MLDVQYDPLQIESERSLSKIVSPLAVMVRKLASHTLLNQDDRDALLALPHTTVVYDPMTFLVNEGSGSPECTVLLSGFASRQKWTTQGTRQIVSIYVSGDTLDFDRMFFEFFDENIQAATRVEIAVIPHAALFELAKARPSVAHAIVTSTLVDASISRERLLNIGQRNGRSRVAHLLCEFAVRLSVAGLPQGQSYNLPFTQEHMADALGLTPVHVNRMLKVLEAEGLISRVGRCIAFPQWDALCEVAGFSSRYLYLKRRGSGSLALLDEG
ncbi:MAG: Crp/Fnr family transcriptional regulator [Oxalobacteraceae bacterium]|nr:MAG: Crp/Fnr family transcriptional regulator [Oxalobacteraceae bacterium]